MSQEQIEKLKQKLADTAKAARPFVFDHPAAPAEEVQRKIILAAPRVFGAKEFLTPFAPPENWNIHFADCIIKL